MRSDDSASAQKEPLIRNPTIWLIVSTLFLLLGQAVAATPWDIPAFALLVFVFPFLSLFWREQRGWALLALLAGLSFSLGYIRHYHMLHPVFAPGHIRSLVSEGDQLYIEGMLHKEPEKLPQRSRWIMRAERIWRPTGSQEISGDLLISVRNVRREWRYGDRVRLWLRPLIPRDNGNPGGFDSPSYLARQEIYLTAFLENDEGVELLARKAGGPWSPIEYLRREIRRFIERHFSQDSGALMKALVIGDMGGISKKIRADFTDAGVNHVLSISGLHVGMLGLVVFWLVRFGCSLSTTLLLRWNLLKIATFCSFLAVLFYTALAGAMVPTVRSAIMIGVYELAVLLDRGEEGLTSLTFAAFVIALVWPGVISDISFQLSFLAVLFIAWGMCQVYNRLQAPRTDELPQERSWWKTKLRGAGLHLAVPLLATLGTGPLIAHYFGHLSLAGFFSNPLIVSLVGFVVVPLGLLIGFLSLTLPTVAAPLVWLTDKLLELAIFLFRLLANLPLANISVPAPNLAEVALLYGFIAVLFLIRSSRTAVAA